GITSRIRNKQMVDGIGYAFEHVIGPATIVEGGVLFAGKVRDICEKAPGVPSRVHRAVAQIQVRQRNVVMVNDVSHWIGSAPRRGRPAIVVVFSEDTVGTVVGVG